MDSAAMGYFIIVGWGAIAGVIGVVESKRRWFVSGNTRPPEIALFGLLGWR